MGKKNQNKATKREDYFDKDEKKQYEHSKK